MHTADYDAIVIGGGLAGLTAALFLVQAGCQVLLLEKNRRLGGYAVSYSRRGHRFDIATQALGSCENGGLINQTLQLLDLNGAIRFLPCEPARSYVFGSLQETYEQSGVWEKHIRKLENLFPECDGRFRHCSEIIQRLFEEMLRLAEEDAEEIIYGFSKHFPILSRYSLYTVKRFLDEEGLPPMAQAYFAARAGYCLLPLQRLSLVGFACTEMAFRRGAWMVQGGVERLPRELARRFRSCGGSIKTRESATRIRPDRGRTLEVETEQGSYRAQRVVSAIDAATTLQRLVAEPGASMAPAMRKLDRLEVSGSYHVGFYSIPACRASRLRANLEIRDHHDANPEEDPVGSVLYVLVPSLVDPSSAPPGRHCLCLSLPLAKGAALSRSERLRYRDIAEQKLCSYFPELTGHLEGMFDLGPKQLALMTGNNRGSAYGWAQTVKQSGLYRFPMSPGIPGLYLAGHWTMPGGGIAGVMTSGRLCAQRVLSEMSGSKGES